MFISFNYKCAIALDLMMSVISQFNKVKTSARRKTSRAITSFLFMQCFYYPCQE
jgi:hypothetical protein